MSSKEQYLNFLLAHKKDIQSCHLGEFLCQSKDMNNGCPILGHDAHKCQEVHTERKWLLTAKDTET